MTQSQVLNIINEGENISVEFKKCTTELSNSVYETVCSFLNRSGGHLLLGVNDDGTILGVNENSVSSMIKNFINSVNNPEQLDPTFYFSPGGFTVDNKMIIYIYIPESSQVHRYKSVEELGSGRKNIQKYAPYYYGKYQITIDNDEKFVFSITYRDADDIVSEPVNSKKESDSQEDRIYRLIDKFVNDDRRPLKRPLNDNERPLKRLLNGSVKKHLASIILLLLKEEGINRNDFIEKLGKGRTTITQCLQILREANIVEFIGSDKTGGYYLTQEAKKTLANSVIRNYATV
jgi:predicted HTH transcriptional regulator